MKQLMQLMRDNPQRVKPQNVISNDDASIYIYDVISADWGVSAVGVIADIAAVGKAKVLNVRISSGGGDVFESRAIMAAIQRFEGKTIAHIDGLCASAATSIALACDEVEMSSGGFFMIHCASTVAWGDKTAMRETANLLEKIEGAIVNDYTTKTGKDASEIMQMMEAETWMNCQEALDNGFIDRIAESKSKSSNTWNLSAYTNAPKPIENTVAAPVVDPVAIQASATQSNRNKLALIEIL